MGIRTHSARLTLVIAAVASISACAQRTDVDSMSPSAKALIVANAGITQTRDDWDDLQRSLPKDSVGAASLLERYRAEHGLPFEYVLRTDAPSTIVDALDTADDRRSCGKLATVFVDKFPLADKVLATAAVIEFAANGSVVQRWALPADVALSDMVEGIVGDELVITYLNARSGVYAHAKPSGVYRISAEIPPPLPAEKWIMITDSTYLRVQPQDDIPLSTDPLSADVQLLGRWLPTGKNDTFVRTDSGLAHGITAQAVILPRDRTPRVVACPSASEFSGMRCRGFPGDQRERLIAFPSPCA